MHKLVIQDDEGKTTVVPLIRDEITVGRKEGNTIRLTERNVSRKHARIVRKNSAISIEDLDSYNGVKVNGARIQGRVDLNVSDRIQIGDYLIEVKTDGAGASVDNYSDLKTQPIDLSSSSTTNPAIQVGSSPGIPLLQQDAMGADAETTKMPSALEYIGGVVDGAHVAALSSEPPAGASGAAYPRVAEEPAPEPHGRLVVLSTVYAGREFHLRKPAMVIGRTEENDIVVNHRSISRNHAKVVRENGCYAIVDLQSSNGVRVNGEEYGKVELRRGDVIDLGHVRLRFVEPGEDFVFGRDAQAVPIPSGSNRGLWLALLGVLIVGIAAVVLLTRSGELGGKAQPSPNQKVPVKEDPPRQPNGKSGEPVREPQRAAAASKLKPIEDAIAQRDWDEAIVRAQELLDTQPDNARAKELRNWADRERDNKQLLEELKAAAARADYKSVVVRRKGIDTNSAYFGEADETYTSLRDEYLNKLEVDAAKAMNSNCVEWRQLQTQARTGPWSDDARSIFEGQQCRRGGNMPIERPPRVTRPTDDKDMAPRRTVREPRQSFEEISKEIVSLTNKSRYPKAANKCRDAYKIKADPALTVHCTIAACRVQNRNLASRYLEMADESQRNYLIVLCQQSGVELR